MSRRHFICCFIVLFFGQWLFAQRYNYDLMSMDDGLPSNNVYHIILDNEGFTWFATDRGVARYDGHNMKVFTSREGLASNDVWGLWEDSKGRIWLYSFAKKMQYINRDTIVTVWEKDEVNVVPPLSEANGTVYSLDSKYFYHYTNLKLTRKVREIRTGVMLLPEKRFLYFDMLDSLVVVRSLVGDRKILKSYSMRDVPILKTSLRKYATVNNYIYSFSQDFSEIYRWNWQDHELLSYQLKDVFPTKLSEGFISVHNGLVFVSTNKGCVLLDENMVVVNKFLPDKSILRDASMVSMDAVGNVFINNSGEGVFMLPIQKRNTWQLSLPILKSISYVGEENNEIFIGYLDGQVDKLVGSQLIQFDKPSTLNNDMVVCVKYIQGKYKVFRKMFEDTIFYKLGALKDVASNANLKWLVTVGGNGIILRKDGQNSFYAIDRQYSAVITADSVLWSGGEGGLHLIRQNSIFNVGKEHLLYTKNINTLLLDKNENLWVGTDGFGVYGYQKGKKPIVVKGCENDLVLDLDLANSGDIWASTATGIKQIRIEENSTGLSARVVRRYSKFDGLAQSVYTSICVMDSLVFAVGEKEIDVIPINVEPAIITPQLFFKGTGSQMDDLGNIPFEHNDLSFVFEGVSLASKDALIYHYFIDNYTTDTVQSFDNIIEINKVPSGSYKLSVFAEDVMGNRSAIKGLFFSVAKPWSLRWWAYFIYAVAAGLVVSLIVLYSSRMAKRKLFVKQRMAELELQALQSQLNPHFIFNALGAIQEYHFGRGANDTEEYFSGFARLMRLYLESSKQPLLLLQDELELLNLYINLEKLRFDGKFDAELIVDNNLDLEHISIPSMVLQPFVENAINHGLFHKVGKGHLKIEVKKINEDWIHVFITDNGVGRKKAKEIANKSLKYHKSKAMQIIEERLKIMNNSTKNDITIKINIIDLMDEKGSSAGTKIKIRLPSL